MKSKSPIETNLRAYEYELAISASPAVGHQRSTIEKAFALDDDDESADQRCKKAVPKKTLRDPRKYVRTIIALWLVDEIPVGVRLLLVFK